MGVEAVEQTKQGMMLDGWYHERNIQWPGQAQSLQVKKVLLEKKTKFQDLVIFDSETWGRVMLLDGVIQITTRDECSYQEMLCHVPMHAHKNPERVLIIGGGDGGVLREVCKHDTVKHVTMVDIDGDVVETCKEYFPTIACAYNDPRVNLLIGDGLAFVHDYPIDTQEGFDVIIVDSSDPVGPAEKLFTPEFYSWCHKILKPDGVIGCEGETHWIGTDMITDMMASNFKTYALAQYCQFGIPTYPCGDCGIFLGRKQGELGSFTMSEPILQSNCLENMKYYTPEMHRAAFALPKSLNDKMKALGKEHKELACEELFVPRVSTKEAENAKSKVRPSPYGKAEVGATA